MSGTLRKWNHGRGALKSLNMGLGEVGPHLGSTPTQDTHMEKSSGKHRGAGQGPDSFSLSRQQVLTEHLQSSRHSSRHGSRPPQASYCPWEASSLVPEKDVK